MSNNELPPDPFTPILPLVGKEAIKAVADRASSSHDYLAKAIVRLTCEQYELLDTISFASEILANNDPDKRLDFAYIAILVYDMLEAQARIDKSLAEGS